MSVRQKSAGSNGSLRGKRCAGILLRTAFAVGLAGTLPGCATAVLWQWAGDEQLRCAHTEARATGPHGDQNPESALEGETPTPPGSRSRNHPTPPAGPPPVCTGEMAPRPERIAVGVLLTPLTVSLDIATAPVQVLFVLLFCRGMC